MEIAIGMLDVNSLYGGGEKPPIKKKLLIKITVVYYSYVYLFGRVTLGFRPHM